MGESGYIAPGVGRVLVDGKPRPKFRTVEDATEFYAGRLAIRGSSDKQIKVADGVNPVLGFIGLEGADPTSKPTDRSVAYAAATDDIGIEAPLFVGGGYAILGKLAKGFVAVQGEELFSWSNGRVVPGMMMGGVPAIRVPYVKKAAEFDTTIDLPAGIIIEDVIVQAVTVAESATIDIGTLSTEGGGDADGLIDGESVATAGFVAHNLVDATAANITLGALLVESDIKTADTTALYYSQKKIPGYVVDALRSLSYTTSDATVAGNFYLKVISPGVVKVGKAAAGKDASSADGDIIIEAVI
ncbi:MAG: hypothetical protein A4E30_00272 [Methanomassiliicoccales archaeon PtaB.Bin215]|nr:MAG: hypothetical protein A4E30_00272 [Methanomassiliicoccales archaeon PtaB.Bin215]